MLYDMSHLCPCFIVRQSELPVGPPEFAEQNNRRHPCPLSALLLLLLLLPPRHSLCCSRGGADAKGTAALRRIPTVYAFLAKTNRQQKEFNFNFLPFHAATAAALCLSQVSLLSCSAFRHRQWCSTKFKLHTEQLCSRRAPAVKC